MYKTSPENMKAADSLIKELAMKIDEGTTIQECYGMMHTHKKDLISKASKVLQDLLSGNSEYIPAILCLALCKFLVKKTGDAKTLLEKMTQLNFMPEYSEEFETCYLLLADYYIANGKTSDAEFLLERCLHMNKGLLVETWPITYELTVKPADAA